MSKIAVSSVQSPEFDELVSSPIDEETRKEQEDISESAIEDWEDISDKRDASSPLLFQKIDYKSRLISRVSTLSILFDESRSEEITSEQTSEPVSQEKKHIPKSITTKSTPSTPREIRKFFLKRELTGSLKDGLLHERHRSCWMDIRVSSSKKWTLSDDNWKSW